MILDTTIARYHASKYKKQAPFTMRSPSNVPQLDKKEDTLPELSAVAAQCSCSLYHEDTFEITRHFKQGKVIKTMQWTI